MLAGLGVACAWIALSAAGAVGLAAFGRSGGAGLAPRADEQVEPAHEDIYSLEPLPAAGERWR